VSIVTPANQLKAAIENGLTLPGIARILPEQMDRQVEEVFSRVFCPENIHAIRWMLIELQMEEGD
jgi:hypothetical protein